MKTNFFAQLINFITDKLNRKSTVIVFVGDLVLESLQKTYEKWIKKSELIYIHTDMSQLQMYKNYDKLKFLFVGDSAENNCGKRDFESGKMYASKNKNRILESISNYRSRKIIIISTLRYSSACGISTELFTEFINHNTNTYFIGIKPFSFEGLNALTNFEKANIELIKNYPERIDLIDSNLESNKSDFPISITGKIIELVDKHLSSK